MGSLWILLGSGAIRADEVSEIAVVKTGRVVGGRVGREQFAVVVRSFRGSPTAGRALSRTVWTTAREPRAEEVARSLLDQLIAQADAAGTLAVDASGTVEFTSPPAETR
ncbi:MULTISPECIES: hypothetical protein [unclassified Nocardia]|uniref:hypothetical protein n=1 Tax=unclassified Nocardia TaxID=2637762 RepID=UPI0033A53BC0